MKLKISNVATKSIEPDMIGLFFEDINMAADGGLYAELLENRSFEAVKSMGEPRNYVLQADPLYAWNIVDSECVKVERDKWNIVTDNAEIAISENSPLSSANPHYLRLTTSKAECGFSNKAFDGIYLKKGEKCKASFYMKEVKCPECKVIVKITKDGKELASSEVLFAPVWNDEMDEYQKMLGNYPDRVWKYYETSIAACEDIEGGQFEIILSKPGCVEFDLISLIPEDAVDGVFRKDILNALADLKPGFLRFPGGCIVEGTSLMRRYRWKNTVGDLKDRVINTNLWALTGGNTQNAWEMQDSHYMQSYGIGFYEYFLLCERLSSEGRLCKPVPVINIGVACQFRSYEVVPVDSPEFEEYLQDALDLIEFANGDVNTKWGALRAKMGHPESFNLTMIAIGNEQWESQNVDLDERYLRFEKAIHDAYPQIKCLGTAGAWVENDLYERAWNFYREEGKKKENFCYAVDEHYYVAPQWLYDHVDFYDSYPRDIAVFAGEYASHDANLTNSIESAIAEAAMMTGMERNADVVKLASYAPLLNRIGHSQWTPDMIWFDEKKVVLTPSYYVQKMFSTNSGSEALELLGQEKELAKEGVYISLVKNKSGEIILKLVNSNEIAKEIELVDIDNEKISEKAKMVTLQSCGTYKAPIETAGIDPQGPCKAVDRSVLTNKEVCEYRFPEDSAYTEEDVTLDGVITLPAKSVTVVRF